MAVLAHLLFSEKKMSYGDGDCMTGLWRCTKHQSLERGTSLSRRKGLSSEEENAGWHDMERGNWRDSPSKKGRDRRTGREPELCWRWGLGRGRMMKGLAWCCWQAELRGAGDHAEERRVPPGQQFQPKLGNGMGQPCLELRGLKESSACAWGETSKKKNDPTGLKGKNLQTEREVMTESAWNGPFNALNLCQAE